MADDQLPIRLLALNLERVFEIGRARLRGADADLEQSLVANREARIALLEGAQAAGTTVPGLAFLERFGLSVFELDVLHLAVGVQLDPRLAELVRSATPDGALTVGAAMRLLASSLEARVELAGALGPRSRLVGGGLLRPPIHAGLDGELVATRRTVAALCGRSPRDRLPPWARIRPRTARPAVSELDPTRVAAAIAGRTGGFAVVTGGPGSGRSTFARVVADVVAAERLEIEVTAARRAVGLDGLAAELAELVEDAAVLGLPVVLDDADAALGPGPTAIAIADAIERTGVAAVLVAGPGELDPHLADRAHLRVSLHGVRGEDAIALWRARAGGALDGLALSGDELQLTPRRIARASDLMTRLQASPTAAIAALSGDASNLLQPTRAQLGLADIVLADETRAELLEVISAIRSRRAVLDDWGMARRLSRGRGLSALFDGEPGTGKTMAAEVVAHEVGLPLQRVNASALVDKFIGETEKNLARVFAQARGGNHVVLFDEADSLFGTRTDVKGANDRYANLEVNVLLQLMEEHTGIVLLTTNLKRNIDQAFLRRIAYKVQFPLPEPGLRGRLWAGLLPLEARGEELDLEGLARAFPLSGGDIKSACLRAAYRAAAQQRKIMMVDLVECAQLECQAMGRVVTWQSIPAGLGAGPR